MMRRLSGSREKKKDEQEHEEAGPKKTNKNQGRESESEKGRRRRKPPNLASGGLEVWTYAKERHRPQVEQGREEVELSWKKRLGGKRLMNCGKK